MNLENSAPQPNTIVEIRSENRWQIYFRLCELEIPCWCTAYQPLTVKIDSAIALIQVWSVVKQATAPRSHLVERLETCWKLK
jgi:hypothetical protein